tara:strand:- start:2617 stop:2820 length:204 start_codon:yes stop_codon:yes gene_type:complete
MQRSKRWSALNAWGMKIAKRSSTIFVIVAMACKLSTVLHHIWFDGSEFRWTAAAKTSEKMNLAPRIA